jgi:hypothetical protein
MIAWSRRKGPFVPKRPQLVRGTKGSSIWWKRSLRQRNMISVDGSPVRLRLRPNTLIVALIDSIGTVELRKSMWTRWIHAWDGGIHFRGRRHWFSCRSMSSRICIMSRWFLPGRRLSLRGGFHRVPRIIRFCWRRRLRWVLDLSDISRPVSHAALGSLSMLGRCSLGRSSSPLWSRRNSNAVLVSLWVDILRHRGVVLIGTCCLPTPKQLQACFDVDIGRIQLSSSGVCIESIICLVIARFVLVIVS